MTDAQQIINGFDEIADNINNASVINSIAAASPIGIK